MRSIDRFLAVAGWLLAAMMISVPAGSARAAPTDESIAPYFRLPQFREAAINRANTHLAYLREVNGRYNLVSMDLATRKLTSVAGYTDADVVRFFWVNDKRLMYRVSDVRVGVGDNRIAGWYAADADGDKAYTVSEGLVATQGMVGGSGVRGMPAYAEPHGRVRTGNPDDFIAQQFASAPFRTTLLRVNSRTGQRTAIDPAGLANVQDWALDSQDVPRAAVTLDKKLLSVHVRDSATSPWRKVAEFDQFDNKGYVPIRFDRAGTLYVAMAGARDAQAIHRFDWAKGAPEPEPLISVKDYDIGDDLIFSSEDALIGVRYEADQPGTYWIDPGWKALQATVDAALPGRANRLSGKADGFVVVRSDADTSPARFYLYDVKARKLSLLGAAMPWIDEKTQAQSDVIRYTARDGLTIPALLTLPRGAKAEKLPLVLLAHGGPNVRGIDWEWERDRQFLASRGYAVLEPDFRGSMGHGWKLFRAGWRQWGLSMQDDLADGVEDLVKRGIVDKDRVCIAGASYGGYATVMGLIRHPDVYKCGISWVGVTDVELLFTVGWSDTANSPEQRYGMEVLIADRAKDKQQLRETSAITQAARLKAPLLLAYGGSDVRVPYDHGRQLRDALKPHNKDVEYVEYPSEGHGWRLVETNVDFWTRAEKLLARTIGKPR